MNRRRIALAAVVLAACGEVQSPTSATESGSDVEISSTVSAATTSLPEDVETTGTIRPTAPTTITMEAPVSTPSDVSVDLAVADLMDRLGVARHEIEVVSVAAVTWRDGSLGCPEPGRAYTQALVAGNRMVLAVAGAEYAYHSGRGREPFYCPPERAEDPPPDPQV